VNAVISVLLRRVIQALRQPFDGLLIEHWLIAPSHGVTKDADAADSTSTTSPGLSQRGGVNRRRPGRGAGRDHVAGFQGGKGGEVGDQEIERKHQPLGGIALAHLAIDAVMMS